MSILTQICALELLTVIVVLYVVQKKIMVKSQILFQTILIIVFISVFLDAYSIVRIKHANGQYGLYTRIVCKSYLISLVCLGYSSFRYFSFELEAFNEKLVMWRKICSIYASIGGILVLVLPIFFHNAADGIYTYGASVVCTYVVALSFVILNIIVLHRSKKIMNESRRMVGLLWMAIWTFSALIQFANNEVLLVGYASAIGVGILFMKLENPASYFDRETGLLNSQSLSIYINENVKNEVTNFIVVTLEDPEYFTEKGTISLALKKFTDFFKNLQQVVVFKSVGWEYIILVQKPEMIHDIALMVFERFLQPWDIKGKSINVEARVCEIPGCTNKEDSIEDQISQYVMHTKSFTNRQIYIRDQEWLVYNARKKKMEREIFDALHEERVEVFYQPVLEVAEDKYTTAEALTRIQLRDGSYMSPTEFIPLAERNGTIIQLGEVIFKKVCTFIRKQKLYERGVKTISVNLSSIQSSHPGLAEQLIDIMQLYGIDPHMIIFEITETAAIRSKENVLDNMRKLIEYGCSFSIDDFGTGYSNFEYIMELPVKIVKFDRKMTKAYFEDEQSQMIFESAVSMLHALHMKIVAEGIETLEEAEVMKQKGIAFIQGYCYARPDREKEFLAFIDAHHTN